MLAPRDALWHTLVYENRAACPARAEICGTRAAIPLPMLGCSHPFLAPRPRATSPRDLARKTLMSRPPLKDLDPDLEFVAADGYAAMFADAPPPTADDLRDLETSSMSAGRPTLERKAPEERREILRIAAVA